MIHVVLYEPDIPWNSGNVGRTCLATGARLHLVEPLGFRIDDAAVRRAGLDYWKHVPLTVWPSWEEIEKALPTLGPAFFFSTKATRAYWDVEFGHDPVLVFGPETKGLPDPILELYADRLVTIPQEPGVVRSLNLSTAAGVAVYEVLRQWRQIP